MALFANSYNVTFGPTTGSSLDDTDVGTTLVQSTWTHLVGIVDGPEASLYKDGALVDGKTFAMDLTQDETCNFWVGTAPPNQFCSDDQPDEFTNLNALIDDVRVYDRALSDVEVLALFQGQ